MRIFNRSLDVVVATIAIVTVLNVTARGQAFAASESILFNFGNGSDASGGAAPVAGLIMDSSGNLYGTTAVGGTFANLSSSPPAFGGTVFELTPAGVESVLWSFR